MGVKLRLVVMNFLQFAVWGSYLVCIGNFLGRVGLGEYISWFYVAQGVVSIFMPAIIGAIADKFIEPQRLLGISHLTAAAFMLVAAWFGYQATTLTLAMIGEESKAEAIVGLVKEFGILELVRTGMVALERGTDTIYEATKEKGEFDYGKNVL